MKKGVKVTSRDFLGGSAVKHLPSNAGDIRTPGPGTGSFPQWLSW